MDLFYHGVMYIKPSLKIQLCTFDDINHPRSALMLVHICIFKQVNED